MAFSFLKIIIKNGYCPTESSFNFWVQGQNCACVTYLNTLTSFWFREQFCSFTFNELQIFVMVTDYNHYFLFCSVLFCLCDQPWPRKKVSLIMPDFMYNFLYWGLGSSILLLLWITNRNCNLKACEEGRNIQY